MANTTHQPGNPNCLCLKCHLKSLPPRPCGHIIAEHGLAQHVSKYVEEDQPRGNWGMFYTISVYCLNRYGCCSSNRPVIELYNELIQSVDLSDNNLYRIQQAVKFCILWIRPEFLDRGLADREAEAFMAMYMGFNSYVKSLPL